jgi:hypothetical protein
MESLVRSVDRLSPRLCVMATPLVAVSCAGPPVTKTERPNWWVQQSRDPIHYPFAKAAVAGRGGPPHPFVDDPPTPAWPHCLVRAPELRNDFDIAATVGREAAVLTTREEEPLCLGGHNRRLLRSI